MRDYQIAGQELFRKDMQGRRAREGQGGSLFVEEWMDCTELSLRN